MGYGYTSLPTPIGGGFAFNNPAGVHSLVDGQTPQSVGVGTPPQNQGGIPWSTIINGVGAGLQAYGAYRQNQDALKLQQQEFALQKQQADEAAKRRAAADPIRQQVQQMLLQRIQGMAGYGGQ